ncbi:MAG: protease inhibitor I42 family protein [Legionella sp.]|uniref:protease inhibitor I42 family protein n=1 Tax=Legionella sp. TaxID=459 RepID=UPI0039E39985
MKVAFSSLLLICSMSVHADEGLSLDVNVNDPGFVLSVPANPSTGFQWTVVQYDKNLLTLGMRTYEKPKTNLIGAGGQVHFTFNLQKGKNFPPSTEVQLKYARSWEPKTAVIKTVKINFIKD